MSTEQQWLKIVVTVTLEVTLDVIWNSQGNLMIFFNIKKNKNKSLSLASAKHL